MALPLQHARLDAAQIAAAANAHDRPAAIVCNAHITGLAVARSLARRGVPVIGLDREPYGVGLASKAMVEHLRRPAVLFGCMDEWVLALSAHRGELEGMFTFPFAGDATVRRILDKSEL